MRLSWHILAFAGFFYCVSAAAAAAADLATAAAATTASDSKEAPTATKCPGTVFRTVLFSSSKVTPAFEEEKKLGIHVFLGIKLIKIYLIGSIVPVFENSKKYYSTLLYYRTNLKTPGAKT